MRFAAQLFTIREFTKTRADFRESLSKLKEMGYESVQLSAVGCMAGENPEVDAQDCRELLDEVGMAAPLTHRPWEEIKHRTDSCIEFHRTIGAELVAIGSIPAEYRAEGLDGYRRFVDDCARPIEELGAAGLMFAYHNHAFEFERMGPLGERPFDVMAQRGQAGFHFELDTYWVVHAGVSLERTIGQLAGRLPMVHVKDRAMVGNEARMAPIGRGNIDWSEALPMLVRAGTTLCAVEQDDSYGEDPFHCLKESLDYLRTWQLDA